MPADLYDARLTGRTARARARIAAECRRIVIATEPTGTNL